MLRKLVIDASERVRTEFLDELERREHPLFLALNKIDLVKKENLLALAADFTARLNPEKVFMISAMRSQRSRFDRCIRNMMASTSRTIRLRDDADDRVARREQRVERRDRERRRPEKHDAQSAGRYHLPARVNFLIFRTIRSRLMPRRRSTKSVPSKWSTSC